MCFEYISKYTSRFGHQISISAHLQALAGSPEFVAAGPPATTAGLFFQLRRRQVGRVGRVGRVGQVVVRVVKAMVALA